MQTQKFSLRQRAKSFHYAFDGFFCFFKTQHNAIIHAVCTIGVIVLALLTGLPLTKWLFILGAVGLVWMAELFNTAIEKLCDLICPQHDPRVKFIKDTAAAAVLVTALVAITTACIIFIPALL